jgi:hypothetical protein
VNALSRLEEISKHLARYRFFYASELELQAGLWNALFSLGIAVKREYRLSDRDRLDFFIEGIAVEVKTDGSAADVMRQVSRYAESEKVQGILLVTAKARHILPASFNGKPLLVHSLLDGAF